jgi:hypothetical protein
VAIRSMQAAKEGKEEKRKERRAADIFSADQPRR